MRRRWGVFVRENEEALAIRMNRTWLLATIEASVKKSLENNPSAGRGERERKRRIDEIHREHVEDRIQIQLTIKPGSPKKGYRESCFIGLVHHHRPIDLVHVHERSCACARVPNKTRLVRFPSIEFEAYLRSIIRRGALQKKQELL